MSYIDLGLLSVAERLCQRFQRLTGRTNVWLAVQLTNVSIIVYFVSAAGYFWLGDLTIRIVLSVFCTGLLYLLTQTVFKVPVEAYENSAYQRVAKGLRNPRRVRDAPLRIVFLTLSVFLAFPIAFVYINLHIGVLLLSYSLIVLTTVVLYLLACDPLPPCAGWLPEWLRGSRGQVDSRAEARRPLVEGQESQEPAATGGPLALKRRAWRPPDERRSAPPTLALAPGHNPHQPSLRQSNGLLRRHSTSIACCPEAQAAPVPYLRRDRRGIAPEQNRLIWRSEPLR